MGKNRDAIPYLERAVSMARTVGPAAADWLPLAQAALYSAKNGNANQTFNWGGSSSHNSGGARKGKGSWYDATKKVHEEWVTGYNFNVSGRYLEAKPHLQAALKMAEEVGWPAGSELQDLRDELRTAESYTGGGTHLK